MRASAPHDDVRVCPVCEQGADPGASFCWFCGHALSTPGNKPVPRRGWPSGTYLVEDTSTINAEQATLKDHGDSIIALVVGKWKVIQPHNPVASFHGNDIGSEPAPQLYNLEEDPGETVNMADRYPDRTKAMLARLDLE